MTGKPSKFADMLRTRKDGKTEEAAAKRGRPGGQGKRNNPNYAQVTPCIPKKLHDETKVNLIRLNNREFSNLIEQLL